MGIFVPTTGFRNPHDLECDNCGPIVMVAYVGSGAIGEPAPNAFGKIMPVMGSSSPSSVSSATVERRAGRPPRALTSITGM